MDRGSYRASQPERRVINQSEANVRPQPAAGASSPAPANDEPPRYRSTAPQARSTASQQKAQSKWWLWASITLLLVIIAAAAVWFLVPGKALGGTAIDTGKYQAVMLSNGQSYIGKLSNLNDDFMRLTDVYYLQAKSADTASDQASTDEDVNSGNFQLIKLGGEVQGPEDEVIISKAQLLYYENLQPGGKASQAIEQYKKSK